MSSKGDGALELAEVPPGVTGVLLMGQNAVDRGAYADAAHWFDTAIALRPRLAVAHTCLGLALMGLSQDELGGDSDGVVGAAHRLEEAAEAFACAAELDPANPMPRYHHARALAILNRHREAMGTLAPLTVRFPRVREEAREDAAFSHLRDHPRFLAMVGEL